MANKKFDKRQTLNLAIGGILTAIVIVLQAVGASIKFGAFSISLILIPVVLGAALCGPVVSAWLGLVFGAVVLLSGDAATFLAISVPGTVITVLLKGVLCGLFAGLVFDALKKKNITLATMAAAIVAPVTNTGVFLLGCRIFFFDAVKEWGVGAGFVSVTKYMLVGFVGLNFLFELLTNIVLCPIVIRIIQATGKTNR
jgi:uncharacterized membrane protein